MNYCAEVCLVLLVNWSVDLKEYMCIPSLIASLTFVLP